MFPDRTDTVRQDYVIQKIGSRSSKESFRIQTTDRPGAVGRVVEPEPRETHILSERNRNRKRNAFRFRFQIWIRIQHKMQCTSQKSQRSITAFWETMLLPTLKRQDFVEIFLAESVLNSVPD